MNEPLRLSYVLTGTGWSECEIVASQARLKVSASYLSDALGNLVLAALSVASGFHAVEFGFDEEPGEYRWSIRALDNNAIELRIAEFSELWSAQPIEAGRLLLATTTTPRDFARAVHACATGVLNQYGLKGYADKWSAHPFPERTLHLLGEAMAEWQ